MTTRIRVAIPGSRPMPPMVLRTPVAGPENRSGGADEGRRQEEGRDEGAHLPSQQSQSPDLPQRPGQGRDQTDAQLPGGPLPRRLPKPPRGAGAGAAPAGGAPDAAPGTEAGPPAGGGASSGSVWGEAPSAAADTGAVSDWFRPKRPAPPGMPEPGADVPAGAVPPGRPIPPDGGTSRGTGLLAGGFMAMREGQQQAAQGMPGPAGNRSEAEAEAGFAEPAEASEAAGTAEPALGAPQFGGEVYGGGPGESAGPGDTPPEGVQQVGGPGDTPAQGVPQFGAPEGFGRSLQPQPQQPQPQQPQQPQQFEPPQAFEPPQQFESPQQTTAQFPAVQPPVIQPPAVQPPPLSPDPRLPNIPEELFRPDTRPVGAGPGVPPQVPLPNPLGTGARPAVPQPTPQPDLRPNPGAQGPTSPPAPPAPVPQPAVSPAPTPSQAGGKKGGKKKGGIRKKLVLLGGGLFALVAAAYVIGLVMDHADVPLRTTVLGVDIGGLERQAAMQKLDDQLAARASSPMTLSNGKKDTKVSPSVLGLGLDSSQTVDSVAGTDYNPLSVIGSLFGGSRPAEPVLVNDKDKRTAQMEKMGKKSGGSLREGGIEFVAGRPTALLPRSGEAIDPQASGDAVHSAWLKRLRGGSPEPVELSRQKQDPKSTAASVSEAMKSFGRPAMSGLVTLQVGAQRIQFSPQTLSEGDMLAMKPDASGKLRPVWNARALEKKWGSYFDTLGERPEGKGFTMRGDKVTIPQGSGLTGEAAAAALDQALTKKGAARVAVVQIAK
jgi:hypothetical protein